MATVDVDDSSHTGGLAAQTGWLSLRVGGHSRLFYIVSINTVNSRNGCTMFITIILILVFKFFFFLFCPWVKAQGLK